MAKGKLSSSVPSGAAASDRASSSSFCTDEVGTDALVAAAGGGSAASLVVCIEAWAADSSTEATTLEEAVSGRVAE